MSATMDARQAIERLRSLLDGEPLGPDDDNPADVLAAASEAWAVIEEPMSSGRENGTSVHEDDARRIQNKYGVGSVRAHREDELTQALEDIGYALGALDVLDVLDPLTTDDDEDDEE